MSIRRVALIFVVLLCLTAPHVGAQSPALSVNPEAIEFEPPLLDSSSVTGFRFEIFLAGSDTTRDTPVETLDLSPGALGKDGRIRVELKDVVLDLPNGRYIATIRTVTLGRSEQGEPSNPFVLAREGSVADRVDSVRRERFWTKIGIAIGAGIILVPLLVR